MWGKVSRPCGAMVVSWMKLNLGRVANIIFFVRSLVVFFLFSLRKTCERVCQLLVEFNSSSKIFYKVRQFVAHIILWYYMCYEHIIAKFYWYAELAMTEEPLEHTSRRLITTSRSRLMYCSTNQVDWSPEEDAAGGYLKIVSEIVKVQASC